MCACKSEEWLTWYKKNRIDYERKKQQALLHKKVAILLMHRPFFIALACTVRIFCR